MLISNQQNTILGDSYALLDSGHGEKLEQFGIKRISRLSSLAIWPKRLSSREWDNSDAYFDPKKGWQFTGKPFDSWEVAYPAFKLKLRLQTNGQVGLFPEHSHYLPILVDQINSRKSSSKDGVSVLSLFAYTGMATVQSAILGASVVHVDVAKKALNWARENLDLNNISPSAVRLIPEDSISFLKREVKRGSQYDLILIDPPSFSRGEKSKAWKLEEIIFEIIDCTLKLIEKRRGMLFFTCHHQALDSDVLSNIFSAYEDRGVSILESCALSIPELNSKRRMPAGVVTILQHS